MLSCGYRCFNKIYVTKDAYSVPIKDIDTIKWFSQFGHSHQKYVPKIIKDMNKSLIRIFLDAFNLGDGSMKKGKTWKGYQFSDSFTHFTSSDRLASDIGEMILKMGMRPSYSKQKAKLVKHRNGTYQTKHPCWIISELKGVTPSRDRMKIEKVDYTGMVYDVSLDKNYSLFARRNGKVVLSGNCRSALVLKFADE